MKRNTRIKINEKAIEELFGNIEINLSSVINDTLNEYSSHNDSFLREKLVLALEEFGVKEVNHEWVNDLIKDFRSLKDD